MLFVLPSLLPPIGLSALDLADGHLPLVAGVFAGIKPAALTVVAFAVWRIGTRALKNAALWLIAATAFVAIFALRVSFPAMVLGAGAVGCSELGTLQLPAQQAHRPSPICTLGRGHHGTGCPACNHSFDR